MVSSLIGIKGQRQDPFIKISLTDLIDKLAERRTSKEKG